MVAALNAQAAALVATAVPANTRGVDASAWARWTQFCALADEDPSFALCASDLPHAHELLVAFTLWVFQNMQPRRAGDHPSAASAAAVTAAVRRVLRREGIDIPPPPRLPALLRALGTHTLNAHGPAATTPTRKLPLLISHLRRMRAVRVGSRVAGRALDWGAPFWRAVWACFVLMFFAGLRKSDAVPSLGTAFARGRLSRGSISFRRLADGTWVLLLVPPRGKADQLGQTWANDPIVLPLDDASDPLDAGYVLQAFVAAAPQPPGDPFDMPLFTYAPDAFLTGRDVDEAFSGLLAAACPECAPADYSPHSFRIGAATSLQAAGADLDTIRRTFRWAGEATPLLYARTDLAAQCELVRGMRSSATAARPSPRCD